MDEKRGKRRQYIPPHLRPSDRGRGRKGPVYPRDYLLVTKERKEKIQALIHTEKKKEKKRLHCPRTRA